MDHSSIQEKLEEYIKRDLGPDEFNSIANHLETCRICREEHESLQKYFIALENLETVSAPPNFLGSVYKKINQKTFPEKMRIGFRSFSRPPVKWLVGSFLGFLVILGIVFTKRAFIIPGHESVHRPSIVIAPQNEIANENLVRQQKEKNRGLVAVEELVIVEGGSNSPIPGDSGENQIADPKLASTSPEVQPSASRDTSASHRPPTMQPLKGRGGMHWKDKAGPSEGSNRKMDPFLIKEKNIRLWAKQSQAIYQLGSQGLNVVELNPARGNSMKDPLEDLATVGPKHPLYLSFRQGPSPDTSVLTKFVELVKNSGGHLDSAGSGSTTLSAKIPANQVPRLLARLLALGPIRSQAFQYTATDTLTLVVSLGP